MINKRIYNWSIPFTGLVSFGVWYLVRLIEFNKIDGIWQLIINLGIGAFFSFGFFTGTVLVLNWLITKCKLLKKIFFSSYYIEGVWIGFSVTERGLTLMIQQIEQRVDDVSVYGQTFNYKNGIPEFRHISKSTGTSFDYDKHSLYCTYISDKPKEVNAGFLNYQFINQGKKAPDKFWGYLANYNMNGKAFFMCKRLCDIEKIPEWHECINEAKKFYESNIEYFKHIISDENAKKIVNTETTTIEKIDAGRVLSAS